MAKGVCLKWNSIITTPCQTLPIPQTQMPAPLQTTTATMMTPPSIVAG